MSIANALNNAISGLTATSRSAEVVSSNLANALTPGYSRREIALSPRVLAGNGGGVHVDGVSRIISDTVLADYRLSNAAFAKSSVTFNFYSDVEAAIGAPQDSGSLSSLISEMETALIAATSRPDSQVRLRSVSESAQRLATKINTISTSIQNTRTNADRLIEGQVTTLNNSLAEVARLNRQIIVEKANNRDTASLEDARRAVVDSISSIVPVREVPRENGRIALFTQSGAVLLDGKSPTKLSYTLTGQMTPDIDNSSPQLGRLSIDGVEASQADMGLFSGGSLSELFNLRDNYAPSAQTIIDSLARELHDRFADPTIDSTIAAGGSGLFVDAEGPIDAATQRGLAQRLRVNPAVDESQGGEVSRIRDGIYALTEGDTGDSARLEKLRQAMSTSLPFNSDLASGSGSIGTFASALLSDVSSRRLSNETLRTHDLTLQTSLQDALLADGVDSDREMEMLLQLEKAYAANAKVIQVVDEMLDQILRI